MYTGPVDNVAACLSKCRFQLDENTGSNGYDYAGLTWQKSNQTMTSSHINHLDVIVAINQNMDLPGLIPGLTNAIQGVQATRSGKTVVVAGVPR